MVYIGVVSISSLTANFNFLMQYKYLISRTVDPILAISIGTAAYYVHEYRHGRPQGHTLNELVMRWYNERKDGEMKN